jgi:hypothetical protein
MIRAKAQRLFMAEFLQKYLSMRKASIRTILCIIRASIPKWPGHLNSSFHYKSSVRIIWYNFVGKKLSTLASRNCWENPQGEILLTICAKAHRLFMVDFIRSISQSGRVQSKVFYVIFVHHSDMIRSLEYIFISIRS